MEADKVLLFVRSIDQAEREAIGIELEEDEGANGLTEDWSKVGRVCQRMDDKCACKARWKAHDDAPSPQEEVEWQRAAARIGFEARIAEAYAALKAMLEDEERSSFQSKAKEADLPHEMAEYRYDGVMREGVKQNTLPTCGERMAKDQAENQIADKESEVRRFRAPYPKTLDIGESNPGGVWAIERKTVADLKQPATMDKRFYAFPHTCSRDDCS